MTGAAVPVCFVYHLADETDTGMTMPPRSLNLRQVAGILNVSERSLRRWAQRGDGPPIDAAGRITVEDLNRWVESRTTERKADVA